MTENPTPEEIVEVAKSGSTGMVKTLSDIRMDKMAQEIAELKAGYQAVIKENEELRKANQELYSFAAQVSHPENQAAQAGDFTLNSPTAQPVAAAPINAEAEAAAQKAKEDNMLSAVLTQMGYKKTAQSNIDNTPKDGR